MNLGDLEDRRARFGLEGCEERCVEKLDDGGGQAEAIDDLLDQRGSGGDGGRQGGGDSPLTAE